VAALSFPTNPGFPALSQRLILNWLKKLVQLMAMQNRARLLAKLAKIQGKPRAKIREALQKNAEELTAMQGRFAPTDSGALKASIGYTFGQYTAPNANVRGVGSSGAGDPDLTVHVHAGDERAWYARIVEFGTRAPRTIQNFYGQKGVKVTVGAMPAQPFFYPAYRVLKKRMKSRVTRAARKAIREAVS
jgi:HK97 gp10 family phage protein